jgi:hypothetical protein
MQYPSRDQADALNARGMSRAAVAAQAWLARLAKPRIFTSACSGMPQSVVKRDCWCGREDSNLHGLPR